MKDIELEQWEASGSYLQVTTGPGMKVFVKEVGNSNASAEKTLLLLHGFPESSFSYHLVINGLTAHFERIILFDFPGYGFSDKPRKGYSYSLLEQADVALAVWKHFGITGGHLLSHDMGNSVATELVAREVEHSLPNWFSNGFQTYTFTNGSVVLALAELRIMQKLLLTRFGKFLSRLSTKGLYRNQLKSAHGDAPLDELEISRLWEMTLHKGGRSITHLTIKYIFDRRKYESTRWLPALTKTKVPIHISWGDKDQVAKVEIAYYLKEKVCPAAKLSILKNVGHFCQIGSPDKWLQSTLSFYK